MFNKKNEDELYRAAKKGEQTKASIASNKVEINDQKDNAAYNENRSEEDSERNPSLTPEEAMNNNETPTKSKTIIPYLDIEGTNSSSQKTDNFRKFIDVAIITIVVLVCITLISKPSYIPYEEAHDDSEVVEKEPSQIYRKFIVSNINGEKIMEISCRAKDESYAYEIANDKGITTTDIYISDQQLQEIRKVIQENPLEPIIIRDKGEDRHVQFLFQFNVSSNTDNFKPIDTALSAENMQKIVNEAGWGDKNEYPINLDALGYKNILYSLISYENDEYLLIGAELK